MIISIGSDHGGFELKEEIIKYLSVKHYSVEDRGCFSNDSVDYPDIAEIVGDDINKKNAHRGILICGTGIGISMAANKIKGIRAALCTSEHMAEMTRKHNDANILCLGGRTTETDLAKRIVDTFITTDFEGDRHQRRIDKITALENK